MSPWYNHKVEKSGDFSLKFSFSIVSFYGFFFFIISWLVDESMFKWSFIIYYIKEKLLPETHFYPCRQTEIIIFKDL